MARRRFGVPSSNNQKPSDVAVNAHTNILGLVLAEAGATPSKGSMTGGLTPETAPYSGYYYETPSSLACVYGFVAQTVGCNPANASAVITGGAGLTIAIVDAYHNPSAIPDLAKFHSQFFPASSPAPSLSVVYANGLPANDAGWALELSLDIEWAHAMSPNAKIILVEALNNSYVELMKAVTKASNLVNAAGGGVVSMSWGGSEFSTQSSYDSYFKTPNVTYLASSGDAPGVLFPSTSAYVVSVGGTAISRNASTGNYQREAIWQLAGGGNSAYVARPAYQNGISATVGAKRGVPDIAAVADPSTGVWVYSGYRGGWWIVGGTSVASPVEAGIMSHKGVKYPLPQGALTAIYNGSIGKFRDITVGDCGRYDSYVATAGWDFCSGRGSLLGGLRTLDVPTN